MKAFVSYAHKKRSSVESFLAHLKPAGRKKLIEIWIDHELLPGDKFDKEIAKNIDQAEIVILCVDVEFLNSYYIYERELKRAYKRHKQGKCIIVPVILDFCDWEDEDFAEFQVVPEDGKPITAWNPRTKGRQNAARNIKRLLKEYKKK